MARVVADFMGRDLGKTVIVENKPGAGTIMGTAAAASSTPDGYTLLMASAPYAIIPSIKAKLPYDPFKAFAPVALVARSFDIVVVNPKLPFKSVQDVIAYAKANPGKLNFGSPGIGSSPHLAGELFKSLAHVNMTHVPYKGSAPALTDLLSGQIQLMFSTVPSAAHMFVVDSCVLWRSLRCSALPHTPTYRRLPRLAWPITSSKVGTVSLHRRDGPGCSEPAERIGGESHSLGGLQDD